MDTVSHDLQLPPNDLRYYNKLMSGIPVESESVPLILDCLLEQVCTINSWLSARTGILFNQ